MGLYDEVNYTMPCPKCGAEVTGWQSKEMGENLKTYNLNQLWDGCTIASDCWNCKEWLTVIVRHVTPPTVRVEVVGYGNEDDEEEIDEVWRDRFILSPSIKQVRGLMDEGVSLREAVMQVRGDNDLPDGAVLSEWFTMQLRKEQVINP